MVNEVQIKDRQAVLKLDESTELVLVEFPKDVFIPLNEYFQHSTPVFKEGLV